MRTNALHRRRSENPFDRVKTTRPISYDGGVTKERRRCGLGCGNLGVEKRKEGDRETSKNEREEYKVRLWARKES